MALPILFWVGGIFWKPLLAPMEYYTPVLCCLLLVDRFLLSQAPRHLQGRRLLEERFSVGREHPVLITLVNTGAHRILCQIFDAIPPTFTRHGEREQTVIIPPFSQETLSYSVLPSLRGTFEFGQIHMKYASRLGLLWIQKVDGRREAVKVYPDLKRIRRMQIKHSKGQGAGELQKRLMGLEGTQFVGLRTYHTGDDIRKMDWKATARMETPVTRIFSYEVEQPILVLLDAGRKMMSPINRLSKLDHALNAALAFTAVALDRGDQVSMGIFSNKVIKHVPFGQGKKHLKHLLDTVSEVQPEPVEPHYEESLLFFARSLKRRALVILFTDLIDPMASYTLRRSLQSFSHQHLLVVVTLSDAHLLEQTAMYPQTPEEAYQKGVALDLLDTRRKSLRELSKLHGATVLDTQPIDMDEALINHYVGIKLRNRL